MGANSFFSKLASNDPLAKSLNLPGAHGWDNRHNVGNIPPTPYSGVEPTLADANAGYVQQAQRAGQQAQSPYGQPPQRQQIPYGQQPRPTWQQGQVSPYQS